LVQKNRLGFCLLTVAVQVVRACDGLLRELRQIYMAAHVEILHHFLILVAWAASANDHDRAIEPCRTNQRRLRHITRCHDGCGPMELLIVQWLSLSEVVRWSPSQR
jgi:hypothetical protein